MGKRRTHIRILFIGMGVTLLFLLVLIRLFWVQTVDAERLKEMAENQWSRKEMLKPQRGTIYDRNGELLAYTGRAYTVVAKLQPRSDKDENYVKNPEETAEKLSPLLGMPENDILHVLTRSDVRQVELRSLKGDGWKIDQETADKVEELHLPGIYLSETERRYYPNGAFASHVLGFVNLEGKAEMGVELLYNELLSGKEGSYSFMKDRAGYRLPHGLESIIPAEDGKDLYLTIDRRIQGYVEEALDEAEQAYHPEKMTVIVADPHSGEVLAMANRPHFNPYRYWDISNYNVQINHAVASVFEPGSTFKIVTLAAAVEEGVFHPDETYMSGTYRKLPGANVIRDHNSGKGWGKITFLEGVQRSSNVAFVILGYERLKKQKLFEYIHKFGFGAPTGIGFSGEEEGKLREVNQAYPVEVATTTFGQGVAVTAIQQVAAVSAVANGGSLLKPLLINKVRDAHTGEIVLDNKPHEVRKVISPATSLAVSNMLESVVTDGTGKLYNLEGYHVAGKTGTAQKPRKNGRGYEPGKYIHSFIGYAPKDNPELLVYVVVDDPDVGYVMGGKVTSDIFKSIMKNSLRYLKILPETNNVKKEQAETISVPDLTNRTVKTAKQLVLDAGLNPKVIGKGDKVIRQYPDFQGKVEKGGTVYLVTEKQENLAMPDLQGMSLREALEYCSIIGIPAEINGTGYVVEQSIPTGTLVNRQQSVKLRLQPQSLNEQQNDQQNE